MYGADASDIYELLHESKGKDYRAEAEEVARQVRDRAPHAGTLLDVACGTGAHLRWFQDLFDRVEGLELAEPMIAAARRRLPGVDVHAGDMRDFALDRRYDVVTCMFGSIGYLATPDDLTAALRRFARHLTPGGVVAIDPWWFPETFVDGYVAGGVVTTGGRTLARVSHSVRKGTASEVTVHYLVADPATGIRHFSETHLITLFSRRQYEDAFTAAGLDVGHVAELHGGRGLFVGVLTNPEEAP